MVVLAFRPGPVLARCGVEQPRVAAKPIGAPMIAAMEAALRAQEDKNPGDQLPGLCRSGDVPRAVQAFGIGITPMAWSIPSASKLTHTVSILLFWK